jgi:hypothetical protein
VFVKMPDESGSGGHADPPRADTEPSDPNTPASRPVPRREQPTRKPLEVPLAPTAPRPSSGPFRPGPRRADDRWIVVVSILVAAAYLVAAVVAAVAPVAGVDVPEPWLPLHLALAGGASTAIAGVMPFFVAALAAGPPASARQRGATVALVAVGAGLVAVRGTDPSLAWAPVMGGIVYLVGMGSVALTVRASGRAGLMMRRPIVSLGYTLALGNVAIGALLGTLYVADWTPVVEGWERLRPAHAWANLLGFVSVVIIATLLHFLPTVLGGRIMPRRSAAIAVLGPALGSPLVVAGLLVGQASATSAGTALAVVGAGFAVAGALALVLEATQVVRGRGRWTSDPGWHRFASVGLLAGICWYAAGLLVAAGVIVANGVTGDAWSTALVGAPLVAGWFIQVLLASWTHLLPSIGPGGPVGHARQRAVLGRLSTVRLVALNVGVALLWLGTAGGLAVAIPAGAALIAAVVLVSGSLVLAALRAAR